MARSRGFNGMATGQGATFTAYRQEFSLIKAEKFIELLDTGELAPIGTGKTMGTYITDAVGLWRGNVTLELQVTVQNPLVLLNDDKSLEARLWDRKWLAETVSQYDSIVSVPDPKKVKIKARQGLLFYPTEQIISATVMGTHEEVLREFINECIKTGQNFSPAA